LRLSGEDSAVHDAAEPGRQPWPPTTTTHGLGLAGSASEQRDTYAAAALERPADAKRVAWPAVVVVVRAAVYAPVVGLYTPTFMEKAPPETPPIMYVRKSDGSDAVPKL
jgi:hypothetical protein